MSYSPTTTFVDGNPLLASQVEGNITGLRNYLNGGVAAGDLQNVQWVDTKHLMKGNYNGYNNTMNFVSGVCGGHFRTFPTDLMSLMTRANTDSSRVWQNDGGSPGLTDIPWQFITNTAITINIPRACKVLLVQYTFLPGTPYVDDGTYDGATGFTTLADPFLAGEVELYIGEGFITQQTLSSSTAAIARDGSRSHVLQEDYCESVSFGSISSGEGHPPAGKIGAVSGSARSAYTKWKRLAGHGFHQLVDPAAGTWTVGLMGRSQCVYTKFIRWSMSVEAWLE
jgi:hypothetical protein